MELTIYMYKLYVNIKIQNRGQCEHTYIHTHTCTYTYIYIDNIYAYIYVFRTCTYVREAECSSDGDEFRGERRVARHLCAGAHDLAGWLASSIPTPHVCLAARSNFQVFAQISVAKFAKRRKKHIFFLLPSS